MLAFISPAKTLDEGAVTPPCVPGLPRFLEEARELAGLLRELTPAQLGGLMGISPSLAELNHRRFQGFGVPPTPGNAKPAALLYRGDTYQGLEADSLGPADWEFARGHLAILSGLYGVLGPGDLIQPYRLEMGTRLANRRGRDLYAFWGEALARELAARVAGHPDPTLINLASQEYARAVPVKALGVPLVTPVFKEARGGRLQVIGLLAKRARGAMARYLIDRRLEGPEGLKGFGEGGYRFRADLSGEREWVFVRDGAGR